MNNKILWGMKDESSHIQLDITKLIDTRMLLTANSGGGKSHAIRRLLERTSDEVQQIVLDKEDEFFTLREKFPNYVLVGGEDTDIRASAASAALLARRLRELRVSAIISLADMQKWEQPRFVKLFLEAFIDCDRALWHPCMVVIDEAHLFCPQAGSAESAGAVNDLMTRGRKRQLCGVLATQRYAKLHKDAAAEANNKMVGRSTLDVDMARCADDLGFSGKDQKFSLRQLKPGEFFAYGPAFNGPGCDGVFKLKVGSVSSHPPKSGISATGLGWLASGKTQAAIKELADLPKQAQEEAKTVVALQKKVKELTAAVAGKADPEALRKEYQRGIDDGKRDANRTNHILLDQYKKQHFVLRDEIKQIEAWSDQIDQAVVRVNGKLDVLLRDEKIVPKSSAVNLEPSFIGISSADIIRPRLPAFEGNENLRDTPKNRNTAKGALKILTVLAQRRGEVVPRAKLALLSGLAPNGGTYSTYLSRLTTALQARKEGDGYTVTDLGVVDAGNFDPIPQRPAELFHYWLGFFGPNNGAGRILQAMQNRKDWDRAELAAAVEMAANGGSFNTYLSRLSTAGVISKTKDTISLADELWGD